MPRTTRHRCKCKHRTTAASGLFKGSSLQLLAVHLQQPAWTCPQQASIHAAHCTDCSPIALEPTGSVQAKSRRHIRVPQTLGQFNKTSWHLMIFQRTKQSIISICFIILSSTNNDMYYKCGQPAGMNWFSMVRLQCGHDERVDTCRAVYPPTLYTVTAGVPVFSLLCSIIPAVGVPRRPDLHSCGTL